MLLHEGVREGHEENGETPKEGHHYDLQQKHRTSQEKRRVLGLLSCERSRGGGRALLTPSAVLTAGWRGGRVRLFSEVQRKDKSNGHKLQQRKFHLYVGFLKKKKEKKDCESGWVLEQIILRHCEISLPGHSQNLTGLSSDFEVDPALSHKWELLTSRRPLQPVSLSADCLAVGLARGSSQLLGTLVEAPA